ncbi:fimbria/pilus outer membrane usher protein [Dyella kyungheensis]|uniref:fimbria/pilus outer membrane usher protein n=1 Tax=Dyella kyungheensis TaxID=1242174 RepID=UPI003CF744C4
MPTPSRHARPSRLERTNGLQPKYLSVMLALGLGIVPVWAWSAAPAAVDPVAPADPSGGAVEFNGAFTGNTQSVDLSRFEKGNPVMPGRYRVDLYVNEVRLATQDVTFRAVQGSDIAEPCFGYDDILHMGVDTTKLDPAVFNKGNNCITAADIGPDAFAKMDMGSLHLNVSIPQVALLNHARGYVSPSLWDNGETAFLMGYSFNAYSTNTSYDGMRGDGAGMAIDANGGTLNVQNASYYKQNPDGTYSASPNGTYMLGTNGSFTPVKYNSFTPWSNGAHYSDVNAYLGLNLGLNVAGWRLRSQETMQWDQRTGRTYWHNINTTASHDITPWKAQLTIGDFFTQGVVFDTTSFRGFSIYSDDRMLPDSVQGYAPTIRGVANTQARVEIHQNGNLMYETTVAPGPFKIDDLYATGYGGDLVVSVFEADGSTHTFTVPYAAVPMSLRPGISRWAVTDGQIRDDSLVNGRPYFVEGTYQRGITNWLTLYGGVQSTYRALYKAYLGGAAVTTEAGAFGFDVTNSHTTFQGAGESLSGYSARLSYAKTLPSYGTTFAVATYRYSNTNFLSLDEAVQAQDRLTTYRSHNIDVGAPYRNKQRLQVNVSQDFGGNKGSLYLNGSRMTYWNGAPAATTYQMGYSNHWRDISFGLTASRTYSSSPVYNGSRYDNQFGVNLSIPLGGPRVNRPSLSLSATHDDYAGNTDRASITGGFGDRHQYNYNASATYSDQDNAQTTVSGSLGWQGSYVNLGASASHSDHYDQGSVSASGGLVVHPGGVTLAPFMDLNGAMAVVYAPDAQGAASGSTKVDGRGYAVVGGLRPYRMNDVSLDPSGTSTDVELQTTRLQTAPRAGAVIPLKFSTVSGRAVLIRATQPSGKVLPFGADVLDANGQNVGTVGQGGQMFVRGAEEGGTLSVRWGDQPDQQCHVSYQLPARDKGAANAVIDNVEASCH